MQTTYVLAATLAFAFGAIATPLQARDMCNMAPTAPAGKAMPIKTLTTCQTAEDCQVQAKATSGCESFVFGLPASASVPECMLFAVPGADVPSQGADLNVFDVACSSVPTQAPSHSNPVGTSSGSSSGSSSGASGSQGSSGSSSSGAKSPPQ